MYNPLTALKTLIACTFLFEGKLVCEVLYILANTFFGQLIFSLNFFYLDRYISQ